MHFQVFRIAKRLHRYNTDIYENLEQSVLYHTENWAPVKVIRYYKSYLHM